MVSKIFKEEEIAIEKEENAIEEVAEVVEPLEDGEEEEEIIEEVKPPPKKKGKHTKEMTPQRKAQLILNLKAGRERSLLLRKQKAEEKKKLKEGDMTSIEKEKIYKEMKAEKEKDDVNYQIKDLYKKLEYLMSNKDKEQSAKIKKEIQEDIKEVKADIKEVNKKPKKIDVDLSIDDDDELPPRSPPLVKEDIKPIETRTKHYSTIRGYYYK
jgi:hypothetical protein